VIAIKPTIAVGKQNDRVFPSARSASRASSTSNGPKRCVAVGASLGYQTPNATLPATISRKPAAVALLPPSTRAKETAQMHPTNKLLIKRIPKLLLAYDVRRIVNFEQKPGMIIELISFFSARADI
jgi:hypothetical protein